MQSDHQCPICTRIYREKFNLDRHVTYCTFLHESKRERDNAAEMEDEPIPDTRTMYRWMQAMAVKIEKLEKDNDKLRGITRQQQKSDVATWMRDNCAGEKCPQQTLSKWIEERVLPAIPQHLETVYQKDLLSGMTDLLTGSAVGDNLPIRAFANKQYEFHVYDRATTTNTTDAASATADAAKMEWRVIPPAELYQWFALIESHFQTGFRDNWVVPNMSKISGEDEAFSQRYVVYYQKILGNGRMTTDARYQKLRQVLYNAIKQKI